jgi:hypothetical protein
MEVDPDIPQDLILPPDSMTPNVEQGPILEGETALECEVLYLCLAQIESDVEDIKKKMESLFEKMSELNTDLRWLQQREQGQAGSSSNTGFVNLL